VIEAKVFIETARSAGFGWYTGVPCSYLTPFINYVIGDQSLNYVSAANEGDAVAIAAGLHLGGHRAVVMMQNSGLGNAVSPLSSLTHVFGIPMLLICTHRGAPEVPDEPQHALMGQITGQMLDTLSIRWEPFPASAAELDEALARATTHMAQHHQPYAFLMPKGAVSPYPLAPQPPRALAEPPPVMGAHWPAQRPTRSEVLARVIDATPLTGTVVIATTGYTGRELYALTDRANHFYMVGSMGCASAFGLGLALARPDLHVVVVDGDGAALMRMGNFATLGYYRPPNLSHLLLDNEAHDSTGGQTTVSAGVDFASIAAACGYASAQRAGSLDAISQFCGRQTGAGPGFMHVKIATGTLSDLPRPAITPPAVLARLRQHLEGTA